VPAPEMEATLKERPSLTAWFSIGLDVDKDGTIQDVRVGSAADKAGFAPGQKLTAIDGRLFTIEMLPTP
jgi:predicted metalloprotease with PDZ domain